MSPTDSGPDTSQTGGPTMSPTDSGPDTSQTGGPTMSPTDSGPDTSQTGGPTMSPTDSGPDICTTPGCVQLAAQMIAAMNQSVDPCEDFYEFSCGNWGQRNLIPPGILQLHFNTSNSIYNHIVLICPLIIIFDDATILIIYVGAI